MPEYERTGYISIDAKTSAPCNKCGAAIGEPCRMPSGRRYQYIHTERLNGFIFEERKRGTYELFYHRAPGIARPTYTPIIRD